MGASILVREDTVANVHLAENLIEAENAKDYERLFSVFAPDATWEGPDGNCVGPDEIRPYADSFYAAFPDHDRTVVRMVADDECVMVQWRFTGTHLAAWAGVKPTGVRVDIEGCTVWTFRDLRLQRVRSYYDPSNLRAQLQAQSPSQLLPA
jgi:steroid delta-isomerase-like uncharacterized protein